MISIDLADFDTNLDHVQKLAQETFTKKERDAFYDLNLYLVGQKDKVSDEKLKVLIESDLPGVNNESLDSVEDFKEILDTAQTDNMDLSEEEQKTESAFIAILQYIFKNKNRSKAVKQQELAIENNWNIKFKLHVAAILQ